MSNIKNRLKRIEDKASPPKYAGMQETLKAIHLQRQESRTDQEETLLAELKKLPTCPQFKKTLMEIREAGKHHRGVIEGNGK